MADSFHILTLNQISSTGLKRFPSGHYVVGPQAERPDAILVRSHDMHQMDIPQSVKAIGRAGAGTNNIPVAKLSHRGMPVFNAPGANANAVKELVLAGLLIASRNLVPALKFVEGLDGAGRIETGAGGCPEVAELVQEADLRHPPQGGQHRQRTGPAVGKEGEGGPVS